MNGYAHAHVFFHPVSPVKNIQLWIIVNIHMMDYKAKTRRFYIDYWSWKEAITVLKVNTTSHLHNRWGRYSAVVGISSSFISDTYVAHRVVRMQSAEDLSSNPIYALPASGTNAKEIQVSIDWIKHLTVLWPHPVDANMNSGADEIKSFDCIAERHANTRPSSPIVKESSPKGFLYDQGYWSVFMVAGQVCEVLFVAGATAQRGSPCAPAMELV